MAAPSAQDVVAVKRLMRYLYGTRVYSLVLAVPDIRHCILGRRLGQRNRPQIDIWRAALCRL
jgi:hypothetical protein